MAAICMSFKKNAHVWQVTCHSRWDFLATVTWHANTIIVPCVQIGTYEHIVVIII